jgi:hypothetical protein
VLGRDKVLLFHVKTSRGSRAYAEVRNLNGMPALVAMRLQPGFKVPPRFVSFFGVDAQGRITAIDSVVSTPKLNGVRFESLSLQGSAKLFLRSFGGLLADTVAQQGFGPKGLIRVLKLTRETLRVAKR